MHTEIIAKLLTLSRPECPASWSNTLLPLALRARTAVADHAQLVADHLDVVEAIALIDPLKLTPQVTPAALELVTRLWARGRQLRELLDSKHDDLVLAVRGATAAVTDKDFQRTIEQLQRNLPRAEGVIRAMTSLIAELAAVLAQLSEMQIESDSHIVPERPVTFSKA